MITVRQLYPLIDNKRKLKGINVTIHDTELRKHIRLETYKQKAYYNLQDIAVMCGLSTIKTINNYIITGDRDTQLLNSKKIRKKTPIKRLVTQDTVINFLQENRFDQYIEFVKRAEVLYSVYYEKQKYQANIDEDNYKTKLYYQEYRDKNREKINQLALKYYNKIKNTEKYKNKKKEQNKIYFNTEQGKKRLKESQKKYISKIKDSEEYKQKRREYYRKYRQTEKFKEYDIKRKQTEEYRAKKREEQRKYRQTEKYKAWNKARKQTEEYKAKRREQARRQREKAKEQQ